MAALKVGLLVSSTFSSKYVHELALWGKERADIKISHLLVHARPRDSKLGRLRNVLLEQGPYVLLSKILFRLIVLVEKSLLGGLHGDHYKTFDLRKVVDEVLVIDPIVSKSGLAYRFSPEDIENRSRKIATAKIYLDR